MARVLIVATSDDAQTYLTSYWAKSLQNELATVGHDTELLSGPDVTFTRLRSAIAASMPLLEYVVFYGHGDSDRLFGQQTDSTAEQAPILVDDLRVDIFQVANVYAVACSALDKLGSAYAIRYAAQNQHFIGYEDVFAFSEYDVGRFEWLVRQGAHLAIGYDPQTAVNSLREGWLQLSKFYLAPPPPPIPQPVPFPPYFPRILPPRTWLYLLSYLPEGLVMIDKVWAAFAADMNAEGVGYK